MTSTKRPVFRTLALGAIMLLAVISASAALAGNGPTLGVYSSAGTKVQSAVSPKPGGNAAAQATSATPATPAGTLPFTGLDLALICGAGILLIGVGFTLRRATRKSTRI